MVISGDDPEKVFEPQKSAESAYKTWHLSCFRWVETVETTKRDILNVQVLQGDPTWHY